MTFDEPNISMARSNEENIRSIKAYLSSQADTLNYLVARVERLENESVKLKESGE